MLESLMRAVENQNFALLKSLLEHIPYEEIISTLNKNGKKGYSLLHCAVLVQNVEMVDYLTKMGANVDIKDKNGIAPIIYSFVLYNRDIAHSLLKAGASTVNLKFELKRVIPAYYSSERRIISWAEEICECSHEIIKQNVVDLIKKLEGNISGLLQELERKYPCTTKWELESNRERNIQIWQFCKLIKENIDACDIPTLKSVFKNINIFMNVNIYYNKYQLIHTQLQQITGRIMESKISPRMHQCQGQELIM